MTLAALTTEYQILLEHHRRDPDDEHIWTLPRETRDRLEIAWLKRTAS